MSMGGPGDHWYTDLFTHGLPAFGEPIDSLIKDIRGYGGDRFLQFDHPLAQRLWSLWPVWYRVEEQALGQLAAELVPIRDELRARAAVHGWEVE